MGNYDAVAYACVALSQLHRENVEVTEESLRSMMLYLMDTFSESEIYKKYSDGN